jgi:hypothetical protein
VKRISNDDGRRGKSGDEYQGGLIGQITKMSVEEDLWRGKVCGENFEDYSKVILNKVMVFQ